ncbi:MAG: STAS domain-containing protein [Kiritimatiellales bacterium]
MADNEQLRNDLQAAITADTVFIRVVGRGSFQVSAALKQFINEYSAKDRIAAVVIDLAECIGMDSTFMGVLAGLAWRLSKQNKKIELINVSPKNRELLETLGVARVIKHYENDNGYHIPADTPEQLAAADSTKRELAETALQAHENLMKLGDENICRFKRVVEYLQVDIDRLN